MIERIRQKPIEQQIQDEGFDPRKGIQFLQQVIIQAHDVSRGLRSSISPEIKDSDPNQVVTEIDKKVGEVIIQEIQTRYPDHGIIDEEAGVIEGKSPFVWTIDPVDGTAYLASGDDTRWGTMVGLLYDGMPIGGAFSLPMMDGGITVLSMEGVGVFCLKGESREKVIVLHHLPRSLKESIVDFGVDTYFKNENGTLFPDRGKNDRMALLRVRIQENVRKLESGGNPYGWVQMIRGVYGGSLCYKSSKIWDRAPVHHAIVALGGVVTEFDGSPIDYKSAIAQGSGVMDRKFGVCAAVNLELHQALQRIIHDNRYLWENL